MRVFAVPLLIVAGLLLLALALPSKRDTGLASWWRRVRREVNLFARVAVTLVVVVYVVWFVVLPMVGWGSIGP